MEDLDLSESDSDSMERFYMQWHTGSDGPMQFRSRLASSIFVPLYNPGHSSTLFSSAILVLMSRFETEKNDQDKLANLAVFFRRARESLNANSLSEIVYSSYIIAVHALISEDSIETVLTNSLQFCRALKALVDSRTVQDDELLWMETLWQGLLLPLFYICRCLLFKNFDGPREELVNVIWSQVQELLDVSSCISPSDSDIANLHLSTEIVCQKIRSLSISMQFYLDYFLFEASRHSENSPENLLKILGQLILLIG